LHACFDDGTVSEFSISFGNDMLYLRKGENYVTAKIHDATEPMEQAIPVPLLVGVTEDDLQEWRIENAHFFWGKNYRVLIRCNTKFNIFRIVDDFLCLEKREFVQPEQDFNPHRKAFYVLAVSGRLGCGFYRLLSKYPLDRGLIADFNAILVDVVSAEWRDDKVLLDGETLKKLNSIHRRLDKNIVPNFLENFKYLLAYFGFIPDEINMDSFALSHLDAYQAAWFHWRSPFYAEPGGVLLLLDADVLAKYFLEFLIENHLESAPCL